MRVVAALAVDHFGIDVEMRLAKGLSLNVVTLSAQLLARLNDEARF